MIELRGLRLSGIVGVLPHGQAQPQPLELDIDVMLDLAPAGASDGLDATVDYGELCSVAEAVVASSSYALLEALATAVADPLLAADDPLGRLAVSVRTLPPPAAQHPATSRVRLHTG